jgi:rfaE bifunctional protein nucleotidyltransferase chain/domain
VAESIHGLVFAGAREASQHLAPLRARGATLVTTNGCFDLIHAGHVRYLAEAAVHGDLLVVGVNSDESTRRLKGPGRPIQDEKDRALVVASLKMVYAAFVFTEDDPRAFLEVLKPECHVKGGDYTENIIEKPVVEANGGTVRIVSYVAGRSTSEIIRAIRNDGR